MRSAPEPGSASPAEVLHPSPQGQRDHIVSAPSSVSDPAALAAIPPAPPAPVSERTAFAVLGSMLILIAVLTLLLIQTTWIDPASAAEVPAAADGGSLAQR
jgi:hypothetical protein